MCGQVFPRRVLALDQPTLSFRGASASAASLGQSRFGSRHVVRSTPADAPCSGWRSRQILRVGVEECARLDCWSPRCIALATCWRGCKRSSGVPRIDVGARLSATSVSCVTRWTTGPSTPRPPTRKRMRVGGRCGRDDTFSGTTALRNTGPSAPGALVCALTTVSAGSRRSCRPTCFRERLRGSRSPYRALCTCHIR